MMKTEFIHARRVYLSHVKDALHYGVRRWWCRMVGHIWRKRITGEVCIRCWEWRY